MNMLKNQLLEQPLLSVEDLSFGYAEKTVFKGLSFNLFPGDFAGLIGGNGTGKTTLIKLLLGLLSPDHGTIRYGDGLSQTSMGYVSQKATSFQTGFPATVEEVILGQLYRDMGCLHWAKAKHKARVKAVLEMVGLSGYEHRPIQALSGGQQQRVFIARTLASGARLMILDEPTVGIDLKGEKAIYDLLRQLNETQKLTILLVSHDVSAVTRHANRLFCMGANGFFEHCLDEACNESFYRQLYGYEVIPHIHP